MAKHERPELPEGDGKKPRSKYAPKTPPSVKAVKPRATPIKPPAVVRGRGVPSTAFGGERGNVPFAKRGRHEIGEDGLPKWIGPCRPAGSRDIVPFLERISTLAPEELQEILMLKQESGQSLSVGTLSWVRLYLDALTADTVQDRTRALTLINNRRYGLPTTKLANADGSNLNPLHVLLTESSRLRPSEDD